MSLYFGDELYRNGKLMVAFLDMLHNLLNCSSWNSSMATLGILTGQRCDATW